MREWLKRLREEKLMTQQNVADKLNITKQYYQQIETGERQRNMDITLATKLSDLFEISLSEIVQKENELAENELAEKA